MTDHFAVLMGHNLVEYVSRIAEPPDLIPSGVGSSMNRLVPPAGLDPVSRANRESEGAVRLPA